MFEEDFENIFLQKLDVLGLKGYYFVSGHMVCNQQDDNLSVQISHFIFAVIYDVEILDAQRVGALIFYHTFADYRCVLFELFV